MLEQKQEIRKLHNNGAFVAGALRSAVYNFETGNVYSVNEKGTQIILRLFNNDTLPDESIRFLEQVEKTTGLSFRGSEEYVFPIVKPRLRFVWLELTQKCNFHCIHCYQGNKHGEPKTVLTDSEWKNVLKQCVDAGCEHVQFIGGEPTLYKDLADLIYFANGLPLKQISLFSNLFCLTNEVMAAITDCNVVVNFSIYGSTAEVHDRITGIKGSFDNLILKISALKALGIATRANIVLMQENKDEAPLIDELLRSMDVDSIRYDAIRKVYGGTQNLHFFNNSMYEMHKPNFFAKKQVFDMNQHVNSCWYGKMAICSDGTVFPCEFERNITYGNIREQSIIDVLNSDELSKNWYFDFSEITDCKDCEYRFACKDCRPIAYAEKGRLTDKNSRCFYNPYAGVWN